MAQRRRLFKQLTCHFSELSRNKSPQCSRQSSKGNHQYQTGNSRINDHPGTHLVQNSYRGTIRKSFQYSKQMLKLVLAALGSLNQTGIKGEGVSEGERHHTGGQNVSAVANMAPSMATTFTKKTFHTAATVTSPKSSSTASASLVLHSLCSHLGLCCFEEVRGVALLQETVHATVVLALSARLQKGYK